MKTLKLLLPMFFAFGSVAFAAPSIELNNPTFEHYSDAWNQQYGVVFIGGVEAQKIVAAMQVSTEKRQSIECPFGNQGGECIEAPAYYIKQMPGLYCTFPAQEPAVGSATCSFVMFFTETPGASLPGKIGVRDAVADDHRLGYAEHGNTTVLFEIETVKMFIINIASPADIVNTFS